jgi:hypothetical protein
MIVPDSSPGSHHFMASLSMTVLAASLLGDSVFSTSALVSGPSTSFYSSLITASKEAKMVRLEEAQVPTDTASNCSTHAQ